ncbi:MAG: amino acid ABC transporter permease [Gammaproteobacteria bacterium]|nr:MAG: amino acid ABC transporter permease [Gammaproteobacteria bacterium]
MFELLNSRKFRNIASQVITLLVVVLFLSYITNNVFNNIEQRGITTGFGFFNQNASFGIAESAIEYNDTTSTYFTAFLVGLINTLIVSFAGIFFASIIGLIVGIARLSKNYIIAKLSGFYIELFRNIPILLQILFWYNVVLAALPSPKQSISLAGDIFLNNRGFYIPRPIFESGFLFVLIAIILSIVLIYFINRFANKKFDNTGKETPVLLIGFAIIIILPLLTYFISGSPLSFEIPALKGFNYVGGLNYSPEFLALTFALSIYTATYIAEAIRSGIEAVAKGQKEAAKSLGLSPYKSLKIVILPQAIRIAIPPIINQYLNLVKNSSLATAIGYPELFTVFAGTALTQTGQAIEIIFITMLVYLFISLSISLVLNIVNKKLKVKGR